ncbi:MAG: ATP-binding cassette domain-containing protein, partial [Thermoleophilia bacterium]|nr:ATP-binding cassette domain-containing protein [Thermoleophilia bacterium]
MIRVEGLRFAYGDGPMVLDGVDLSAQRGEVILLSGPSGGGKSTLLRALCGLVPHFHGGTISGRVEVAGLDPLRAGPAALAGRVAYAFQEPEAQAVFDTVGRDIAFGPRAAGWPGRRVEEAVARVSRLIGVGDLLSREIATLSGGERQRAGLAAALATGPDVLLLDEPTSQLDRGGVDLLVDLLNELAGGGITVVVAEHRADQLAALECRRLTLGECDPALLPPGLPGNPDTLIGGPVHIDDLHCGYPGREVISGLTATFKPGEISILDGPNGSGKST